MALENIHTTNISWRWFAAVILFSCGLVGLTSGVSLTERPDIVASAVWVKAYYALGLFVVGGMDLGVPTGGPVVGRFILWIAYFGCPLLMASAVVEAVLTVVSPYRWRLKRMKDHIVIVGSGDMAISYLRVLRKHHPTRSVLIVDKKIDRVRQLELSESYGAEVITGDITHDFLIKELRLHRCRRVALMGDDNFQAFEAASKILRLYPRLEHRIIIHCQSLRFLRAMQETQIAKQSISFNSYNLAAKGLVQDSLIHHFAHTAEKDTVVLAGFGLFGQTILEELQNNASDQIDQVSIIDLTANRRVEVVDEQQKQQPTYNRAVIEGDVSNPEVWRKLESSVDLSKNEPVVILGTGNAANNLRTALWIRQKYKNALIFARTNGISEFALDVGREHDINAISITRLVEEHIPAAWLE